MSLKSHPIRLAVTGIGLIIFAVLALGTSEDQDEFVLPSPPPEEIGKQEAMDWARSGSAELAAKLQEVELARLEAQGEVNRLESLKSQFPDQAVRISATIAAWQKIVIKLDSAMREVALKISEAYVAHQIGSSNEEILLRDIAEAWSPMADAALREERALREARHDSK